MPIVDTLADLAAPDAADTHIHDHPGLELLWGEIISISGMTFNVRLPGDDATTNIQYRLDSYTPAVGDRVILARVGTILVALGDIVGSA